MNYTQLELPLLHEDPEVKHKREIEELKLSLEKNRKSLHAKHSMLNKMYLEIKHELDLLKSAICKNSAEFRF